MNRKITLHRNRTFLSIAMALFFMSLTSLVVAQDFKVHGKVMDKNGDPLIGASILNENTAKGTVSDFDGSYDLTFNEGSGEIALVYSYVGYSTVKRTVTFQAGGDLTLDITLQEDFIGLDEVVITGASAATTKKQYGNAISTVGSEEVTRAGASSLDRALSGKISGALINQNSGNPAGGVSTTLRGYSTITGVSDPLYVVDGVIIDNSSTELLDLGGYTQNRLVDINPNDIESIEIIKGAAAAAIYGSQASNGVVQIFTKKGKAGAPRVSFSTSVNMNQLRKQIQENDYPYAWVAPTDYSNTEQKEVTRYNMQDHLFTNGYGNETALSVSGGSKNTSYYMSLSSLYNQGIIQNTDFGRYSARMNIDQIFNDKFSASLKLNFINSKSSDVPNGGISLFYGALTGMNFNNNAYDPNPDESGNYTSPAGWVANPLEAANNFDFDQNTNRMIGSVRLNYTPFEGMAIDYTFGLDRYDQGANAYIPIGSNGVANGYARAAKKDFLRFNNDLNIRYTKEFGGFLKSTSALGFTVQHEQNQLLILTSDKISPFVKTVSGDINGKTDYRGERNIQGMYFQETFGLWDKLFLTGAVRWDQASPFGIEARTQFYPKASVSYLISEEKFWQDNLGFFNTFKLRASYGESGNMTALSDYERFSNYSDINFSGQLGFVPSTVMGNANVAPERQQETEFGVDFSMFENRFGAEITYYMVDVKDLLLQVELAPSSGFGSRYENVGSMTNRGLELALKAVPVQTSDFDWRTNLIYSMNRNQVTDIKGGQLTLANTFGIVRAVDGEPMGVHWGYYYERDENGEIWTDENGLPKRAFDDSGNLRKIIADPNPDWTGSWINEFSYKNFTLNIQMDAMWGFDVFNFTDRVNTHPGFAGGHYDQDELEGVYPHGYNLASYNIWERYIEDGSFIKLREVYLGYNLDPKVDFLGSMTIYVSGRNLYSYDNYLGWDPETSTAGQVNGVRGFDFNEVPIPRTIKIGINATF